MKIVNLTSYDLKVYDEKRESYTIIPKSGSVAWVPMEHEDRGRFGTIPIYLPHVDGVRNLPDPSEGTLYIVTLAVRLACPDRTDLVSPGRLIYKRGRVDGCIGLEINSVHNDILSSSGFSASN